MAKQTVLVFCYLICTGSNNVLKKTKLQVLSLTANFWGTDQNEYMDVT